MRRCYGQEVMWRRWRDLVIDVAPVDIAADNLQPGRRGVLQVLHHPHPATLVEGNRERLAYFRFAGAQLDLEAIGHLHALERFLGREALGPGMFRGQTQCDGTK